MELSIEEQNKIIAETIEFMKNNLDSSIRSLLEEMKVNGEFDQAIFDVVQDITQVKLVYDKELETLTLINIMVPPVSYDEESESLTLNNLYIEENESEE